MKTISKEIIIDSSIDKVWHKLTDFNNYTSWNPFITKGKGRFKVNHRMWLEFQLQHKVNTIFWLEEKEFPNHFSMKYKNLLIPIFLKIDFAANLDFDNKHNYTICKIKFSFSGIFGYIYYRIFRRVFNSGIEKMLEMLLCECESYDFE